MAQCEGLGAVDLEADGGGQGDEGVVGVEADRVDRLLGHLARAVHYYSIIIAPATSSRKINFYSQWKCYRILKELSGYWDWSSLVGLPTN